MEKTRHPVIDVILARALSQSVPGHRADGLKIGLAIEGGSMRGVVSAGMVTALEYLGLLQTFDVIYGTSAGALNGAYLLAGQAAYGTTIYYEDINNDNFIDFRRAFAGRPIVSLEYLLEDVMVNQKPLDWKAVLESPIPLRPIASSVERRCAVALDGFGSRDELFTALKASARMPLVTGAPVEYRGDTFLDGSIYESVPYRHAEKDGCTHILALLTRPLRCKIALNSLADRYLVGPWVRKHNPDMVVDILRQKQAYSADLQNLIQRTIKPDRIPFVHVVCPPEGTAVVDRTEKGRGRLLAGARSGIQEVIRCFVDSPPQVVEVLRPFLSPGHGNENLSQHLLEPPAPFVPKG